MLDPHSAWLLCRSLLTLDVRLAQQSRAAVALRDLLGTLPQVARVYYPAIDGRQLTGYGGLLFFELREDLVDRYGLVRVSVGLEHPDDLARCLQEALARIDQRGG